MKREIFILATVTSLLFTACKNNTKTNRLENTNTVNSETQAESKLIDIPFIVAKNYFVNNSVKNLDNPKIETVEKFNEIFGMATTMGNEGRPTEIDFSRKYVIAVVLTETDLMSTVNPVSLQKDEKGNITLLYKNTVGEKQSYTTRPNFAIIVDKSENGSIVLKEQL